MEGKDGRTERATPKKRQKERKEGNLCLSQEINSMLLLFLGAVVMRYSVPVIWREMTRFFVDLSRFEYVGDWSARSAGEAYFAGSRFIGRLIAPLLLVAIGGALVASIAQTKPYFSTKALKWKWNALNPVKGFGKLFSMTSLVTLGFTLLKLTVLSTVVYAFVRRDWQVIMSLNQVPVAAAVRWMLLMAFKIAVLVACVHSVIALLDWSYKKYQHEKGIMMTKEEVKEERKQEETSPIVKRAQMKKMRELSLSRMIAAVPNASVIITNPTHVAVALEYDPQTMTAPKVTAKGLRFLAQRIKKIAAENNVPIIERPVVARALYKNVKVGQEIPGKFYEAVAAVLAYLHKIGKGIAIQG